MSVNNVLLMVRFAQFTKMPDQVTPAGQWQWNLSQIVGEIGSGLFLLPLGHYTESELMSLAQNQAVIEANLATNDVEQFEISDVRGGAI